MYFVNTNINNCFEREEYIEVDLQRVRDGVSLIFDSIEASSGA
jgi:hypothetical protein